MTHKELLNMNQRVTLVRSARLFLLRPRYSPILEQPEALMSPDSHQTFNRETLKWFEGLMNAPHPSGHLTRRVDIMWLHILCKVLLLQKYNTIDLTEQHDWMIA